MQAFRVASSAGALVTLGLTLSSSGLAVAHGVELAFAVAASTFCPLLLLGIWWSMAYSLVAFRLPGAFAFSAEPAAGHAMHGFTSLYFSFITLSTVGYGDITPVSDLSRMLAAGASLVDVRPATDVPGLRPGQFCHAGPPIAWPYSPSTDKFGVTTFDGERGDAIRPASQPAIPADAWVRLPW